MQVTVTLGRIRLVSRISRAKPVCAPRVRADLMRDVSTPPTPQLSRWIPGPRRAAMLVLGLWLFGTGEAMLVVAGLGNSPWTVFAQGIGNLTGLSVGIVTNIVGACVLVLWIPLRQKPGLGTLANVALIGTAIDVTLRFMPEFDSLWVNLALMFGGIAVVGLGSGFYLGAGMGPGPRDGLMTGLHRRFGWSIAVSRWTVEGTVLVIGFFLGGVVGIGTVAFALLIGPAVSVAVRALSLVPTVDL